MKHFKLTVLTVTDSNLGHDTCLLSSASEVESICKHVVNFLYVSTYPTDRARGLMFLGCSSFCVCVCVSICMCMSGF